MEENYEDLVKALRKIENAAQVVLDSGFGTHEGESDSLYRNRRDIAKRAADAIETLQEALREKNKTLDEALSTKPRWSKLPRKSGEEK